MDLRLPRLVAMSRPPSFKPTQDPWASAPLTPGIVPVPGRGGGGWLKIIVVALAVVLVALAAVAIWRGLASPGKAASPTSTRTASPSVASPAHTPATTAPVAPVEVFEADQRPGYRAMVDHLEAKRQKYLAARDKGTLPQLLNPGVTVDDGYTSAFLAKLTDMGSAVSFSGFGRSTDPGELDDLIRGYALKADQLERRFLAGEDLGFAFRITLADGTVVESDGVNQSGRQQDPEEWLRSFVAEPGADGTYLAAGQKVAEGFGMSISHGFGEMYGYCTKTGLENRWVAAFCPVLPDVIFINTGNPAYPSYYSDARYVDTLRHEVAHRVILDRCATTSPPVAGKSHEAVTNSYAVRYLGADFDRLQPDDASDPYFMTPESERAAEQIRAGACG